MAEIWEKDRFSNGSIDVIIDGLIREYDITKANISILLSYGVISKEQYNHYLIMPKYEREVSIGLMQARDSGVTTVLQNGFKEARKKFIEMNGLSPSDILSIRKDAIYVIGNIPIRVQSVSPYIFFKDTPFTSFYRIDTKEFFYFYNPVTKEERIEVKGINDSTLTLHRPYMLDFILELFQTAQLRGIQEAINLLNNFYSLYTSMNLGVGYYRRFDASSMYDIRILNPGVNQFGIFRAEDVAEVDKNLLDISYNANILRKFSRLFSSIYFR